jgi:RNAse (barnase) inhibitor barstar
MSSRAQSVEIDLGKVATEEDLHTLLMQRLEFPHYYGKNWDAFWDVITEPDCLPQTLTFHGWGAFEQRQPEAARHLRELLRDVGVQYSYVDCKVEYA